MHICTVIKDSSVLVSWTKQVCFQTRLSWWQWWGTPDIFFNWVTDRRWSRKKCYQVLPYCVQVDWEEAWCMSWSKCCRSVMLFLQNIGDIWSCSAAVTVIAHMYMHIHKHTYIHAYATHAYCAYMMKYTYKKNREIVLSRTVHSYINIYMCVWPMCHTRECVCIIAGSGCSRDDVIVSAFPCRTVWVGFVAMAGGADDHC